MKNRSEKRFQGINREEIKELTTVVKETLATVKPRRFGVIDMWDIQRRGRTRLQRRQYLS